MGSNRFVLFLSIAVGCGACGEEKAPFRVATYNTGLAFGFVPHTRERAPLTLKAISELDADLVCLQELWDAGDLQGLFDASAERLPHHYNRPPDPDENAENAEPLCTNAELDPLQACAEEKCASEPLDKLAECVLNNCSNEFSSIGGKCQTCLAGAIGNTLDKMREICTSGGGVWAYGGAYGTAIVSRYALEATDSYRLDSHINRRAVLHARVESADQGSFHVFCTHLSAIFANIPFPEDEGSWEEEQAAQIKTLLAYVNEKAIDGAPVLILGDLNTGPALAGLQGEAPQNFARFIAAGFRAPYLEGAEVLGTYDPANPIVDPVGLSAAEVIDHVLVRGFTGTITTERLLDEPIQVKVGGQMVPSEYSDHYGVGARFEK